MLETIKEIIYILASLATIVAIVIAVFQYFTIRKQNKLELLTKYNARYCINEDMGRVIKYLEKYDGLNHHGEVYKPDDHQVEMFMRFFEEIELLIKQNAMEEEAVYYMFSYYVLKFEDIIKEWPHIEYNTKNWKEFHEFVARMKKINKKYNN